MALFRRGPQPAPPPWPPPRSGPAPVTIPADDSPQALRAELTSLNHLINSHAGRLPVASVVAARRVTDLVADVLRTADAHPLDVYAVLSIKGIVTDYLPTTVRRFLAVDESLVNVPTASGRTPTQSLAQQLTDLETSATAVLSAVREQDADALMTQGSFLSTKFSRSDLDL